MTADSDLLFSFTYNGRYGGAFAIDPSERLLFYEITNHIPRGNSYVMDMETNRNLQTWPNMTLPDNQFTYSHDGKLAAFFLNAFNGTQMIVYDLANQRTIYWAFKPYMNVYGADFSLDGKYLAHFFYGENDTNPDFFYIMDVTNPYRATRFSFQRIPGQWPTAISYSPLGTTIAIGFSGGITCMFDSAKGTMLNEWQSNNTQIKALAFTPDGKFLATASEEGAIRLWGIYP
jgi:WD40 repeat protein